MPPDMPAFTKAPPELVERFNGVLDRLATSETTRRPMFGYPCAFVGGNMATGLFRDRWWVRLPPDQLSAVLASGEGRPFEAMPGRPMKGYVIMSDEILRDDATVDAWVGEALAHTGTLPPKESQARPKRG